MAAKESQVMSKRYGRNQKRKHRERIAQLERDLVRSKAKCQQVSFDAGMAEAALESCVRAIETIAPHSIAAPVRRLFGLPRVVQMDHFQRDRWLNAPFARGHYARDEVELACKALTTKSVDFYEFRSWLEPHREQLGAVLHMEFEGKERLHYTVTIGALELDLSKHAFGDTFTRIALDNVVKALSGLPGLIQRMREETR